VTTGSSLHQFVFGIYPYIALTVFFVGSLIRFDRDQYTWKSDSSQLLRRGELRWGSNLFHFGVLVVFFGHLFGFLIPHAIADLVMTPTQHALGAMIGGGLAGACALIGLTLLIHRRVADPRIHANTRPWDIGIMSLLWVQLVLGLWTIYFSAQHLDGAMFLQLVSYVQGIVAFRGGNADLLLGVPWVYRAHIALGGDPDFASVLDNFCWPDPIESEKTPDGAYKLAQLVKTCRGLRDACLAYGLPLISGKDSMKNDAVMNGKKVSIRPTLLVSLMGVINDVNKAMTTDFLTAGDLIVVIGETRSELAGTTLEKVLGRQLAGVPTVDTTTASARYRSVTRALDKGLIRSLHDLADGGLAVALAESALGGRLGADVELDQVPGAGNDVELLFSETPSRFLASVASDRWDEFEALFDGPIAVIGRVTDGPVRVTRGGASLLEAPLDQLLSAWNALEAVR